MSYFITLSYSAIHELYFLFWSIHLSLLLRKLWWYKNISMFLFSLIGIYFCYCIISAMSHPHKLMCAYQINSSKMCKQNLRLCKDNKEHNEQHQNAWNQSLISLQTVFSSFPKHNSTANKFNKILLHLW